jgi:hypothetical protein
VPPLTAATVEPLAFPHVEDIGFTVTAIEDGSFTSTAAKAVHPSASVTATVYDPALNPLAVIPVAPPGDQTYV